MVLKFCLREEISKTIIIIKLGKMVKEEACSMISAQVLWEHRVQTSNPAGREEEREGTREIDRRVCF